MFSYFWLTFLYQPLFNALVWIYSNVADFNLGWAVIWLTVFLRILLLPLSIISERNIIREERAEAEAEEKSQAFRGDPVLMKDAFRKIMKKHKISPWAKVATLVIQLLVLVLLYQVFVRGITGERIAHILYPFIELPGQINVIFYGFDIGARYDTLWAGICALYLFATIILEQRGKKWTPGEAIFLFLFPLFTFYILWILPMVKSLFILTSMVFSSIIEIIVRLFFSGKKEAKSHH
ncbi:MAG: hypothetical protein A3J93_00445 [Candidatus Magasanikbacteria bacterium RIFOXYC2_FULL_42_28]|uniref:Membrane insertase YidC/Oxa/ALB C-terminal domain-containing protein n=1 Tax=Candidatus Magasanikbacteria bacterium RIFOXYC2_FULL_42_28 TaxID=1798704 RepID=A0A1F6NW94_9BACT|nr:MAG: hypothetical protein A3J93_00445 [Candidatus Magasanikbacteria bacterium RIFOXYC2_FULL_42_28]